MNKICINWTLPDLLKICCNVLVTYKTNFQVFHVVDIVKKPFQMSELHIFINESFQTKTFQFWNLKKEKKLNEITDWRNGQREFPSYFIHPISIEFVRCINIPFIW